MLGFQRKHKRPAWPRTVQGEYRSYRATHPFDERFGVETSGLIYDLPGSTQGDASNNGYFAVPPSVFRQILGRLELEYSQFTFIDLGSGKGRALLLASDYPFREVVGVELSPKLDRIAKTNIARYRSGSRQCLRVRAIRADAAEFPCPAGPLVVYMWNAFTQPVMERVLRNLEMDFVRDPRDIYVIYIHPELGAMLDDSLWLRKLWLDTLEMSEEDYSAWAFPERREVCAVYRTVPAVPPRSSALS